MDNWNIKKVLHVYTMKTSYSQYCTNIIINLTHMYLISSLSTCIEECQVNVTLLYM